LHCAEKNNKRAGIVALCAHYLTYLTTTPLYLMMAYIVACCARSELSQFSFNWHKYLFCAVARVSCTRCVLQRGNKVVTSTRGWILFMLVYLQGRVTQKFVRFIVVVIEEYVKRGNLSITVLLQFSFW